MTLADQNAMCGDKRESIRTNVIEIYRILKGWRQRNVITDQEFVLIAMRLKKIETCVHLNERIEKMKEALTFV